MEKYENLQEDLIHPSYICTRVEDGMGCQQLGSKV